MFLNKKIEIELAVNNSKSRSSQPDLVGDFVHDGVPYDVAGWENFTREKHDSYYSFFIKAVSTGDGVKYRLPNLYEFKKNVPTDPDFGSPIEKPADVLGAKHHVYLKIRITPQEEDILLVLSPEPIKQKDSAAAAEFRQRHMEALNRDLDLYEETEPQDS